jgi:hypothetical protein
VVALNLNYDLKIIIILNNLVKFLAHSIENIALGGDVTYSSHTFHSKCFIPLWAFHCSGIGTFLSNMSGMWNGIACDLL